MEIFLITIVRRKSLHIHPTVSSNVYLGVPVIITLPLISDDFG